MKIHSFRDSFFPAAWQDIKELFAELAAAVAPDVIFTHRRRHGTQMGPLRHGAGRLIRICRAVA